MNKVKIPIAVDPIRSASKRLNYDGIVSAQFLQRLSQHVLTTQDAIARLRFAYDEQKIPVIQGDVSVTVQMTCQRCFEPMDVQVSESFALVPRHDVFDEDANMPEAYEPVEMNELGEVNLHQLLEDAILLGLPLVAKHDERECSVRANQMSFGELPEEAYEENPFAVLKKMKS